MITSPSVSVAFTVMLKSLKSSLVFISVISVMIGTSSTEATLSANVLESIRIESLTLTSILTTPLAFATEVMVTMFPITETVAIVSSFERAF